MTVQERILSIQLMEMIKENPKFANEIGIEAKIKTKGVTSDE